MTEPADHILLLAGTREARLLAKKLVETFPDVRITASFAGAVDNLPNLGVPTRVGGFGGVAGLTDYLVNEKVTLLVDATHPFAAQMSGNAVFAARSLNLPLIRLERPAWTPESGDLWQSVVSLGEAADALPAQARAFLAIGRKDLHRFTHRTDIFALARMIEPPELPLPGHWQLVLGRPPLSASEEIALFRKHRITHVVAKNSGGRRSHAKIEAARQLGLPVIMVDRPKLAETELATSVEDALRKINLEIVSDF